MATLDRRRLSLLLVPLMVAGAATRGLAEDAMVRGRIVDSETGAPLAGEVLAIEEETEQQRADRLVARRYWVEPAATVRTGPDGRFELRLPQSRKFRVDAVAPGHARKTLRFNIDTNLPGVRLPAGKLPAGSNVEGSVVDQVGAPVAGAVVQYEGNTPWGTRTDESGAFVIAGAPAEGLTLTVRAPGYAPLILKDVKPGATARARLSKATSIAGRAVDRAGRPARAVEVFRADDVLGARARSDDAGVFVLPDMGSGEVPLTTRSLDFQPATLRCSATADAVLTLDPAAKAEVHVLDAATKKPIPGARVATPIPGRKDFRYDTVVGDASGAAIVGGLSGAKIMIIAIATGYVGDNSGERVFEPGKTAKVTIELSRDRVILGRVVGDEGSAVADARVGWCVPDRMEGGGCFHVSDGTETDEAGAFRLEGLPAEDILLRVSALGYARQEVAVRSGQAAEPRILLQRGGSVRGRVLGVDGRPLASASVLAFKQDDSDFGDSLGSSTTDPQGAYTIAALPEGIVDILAKHRDALDSLPVSVRIRNGSEAHADDAKLRKTRRLEGRVADETGEPVKATVKLGGLRDTSTSTDDAGHFVLEGFEPDDEFTFTVEAEGFVRYYENQLRPSAKGSMEIVLAPARRIRGRVVAKADGAPVTSYDFACAPSGSWVYEGVVRTSIHEPMGRFDVGGIAIGNNELEITATGFLRSRQKIEVTKSGEPPEITIALDRGLSITGIVRDASGAAIPGAQVHVFGHEPSSWDLTVLGAEPGATTGQDGAFHAEAVPLGKVYLVASAERRPNAQSNLVMTTSVSGIEIVMGAGARVTGHVLGLDGLPAANASVSLAAPSVIPMGFAMFGKQQMTDQDGSFAFEGVEAGPYEIQAKGADALVSEVAQMRVAASDPPAVILHLRGGARLEITVTGLDEADLERLDLHAIGSQGDLPTTGQSGHYVLENVQPGKVELFGRLPERTAVRNIQVTDKDTLVRTELSFASTGRLSGAITKAGKPMAGIGVMVGRDGDADGVVVEVQTDRDGRYVAEGLLDGPQGVWLTLDGGMPTPKPWDVVIAGETHLDIELPSGVVMGRVADAGTQAPIEGARVTVASGAGNSMLDLVGGGVTDATGNFRIEDIPGGPLRVTAVADGYALAEVSASEAEPVSMALRPESSLRLRIKDRRTGEAPREAMACVVDAAGRITMPVQLVADGDAFKVPGVTKGAVNLLLMADDAAPTVLRQIAAPGEANVEVSGGGRLQINLRGTATIQLRAADGTLAWLATHSDLSTSAIANAPTLELPAVAPGTYRLIATTDGKAVEIPVTVIEGQSTAAALP